MKRPRIYQRLARPMAGLASYSSLWRGQDHLLLVISNGASETYQRFRYADIQAVTVSPTRLRAAWNTAWGVLMLVFAISAFSTGWSGGNIVGWLVLFGLALVFAAINQLRGPTCRVFLVTRVKTVRLPFRRRRKADAVLAELQPVIREAQADLVTSADDLQQASSAAP